MKKRALVLLNMGGVSSPDEVEQFMTNMFADPNILPMHPWIRSIVSKRIISSRLLEAKEAYASIGGSSPLLAISRSLASKLKDRLGMEVYCAMRYLPPRANEVVSSLKKSGIEEVILLPLYPHYSTTTVKSSLEDFEKACRVDGFNPKLKIIKSFGGDEAYNELVANRIISAFKGEDFSEYQLILSAHGLPQKIIDNGDIYEEDIKRNVEGVKRALAKRGVHFRSISLGYQSKVGKGRWLEPNLTTLLREPESLKVVIYPLSFCIDNSETVYELAIEHKEIAQKIGYEDYKVVELPNDSGDFVEYLASLVK